MAEFTDEVQQMLANYIDSNTRTLQKVESCLASAGEITDTHAKTIDLLVEQNQNQQKGMTQLAETVDSLSQLVSKIIKVNTQ